MRGRRDPRPWTDRVGDAVSDRRRVVGLFLRTEDGVVFTPPGRGTGVLLERGEAHAVRAVLQAGQVLATTIWVSVFLFAAGNVLFRFGALSSGFLWACLGLIFVANALLGAVHYVLPWALAAGRPPLPEPERAELEPG